MGFFAGVGGGAVRRNVVARASLTCECKCATFQGEAECCVEGGRR